MDPNKSRIDLSKGSTPPFPDQKILPPSTENKPLKVAHETLEKSNPRNRRNAISTPKETKKEVEEQDKEKISNVKKAALPIDKSKNKTGWITAQPIQHTKTEDLIKTDNLKIKIDNLKTIISDNKLAKICDLFFDTEEMLDLIENQVINMTIKDKKEVEKFGEFLLDCLTKPYIANKFNNELMKNKLIQLFKIISAIDLSYKRSIEDIPNIISEACKREKLILPDDSFISFSDILPKENDNITVIDAKSKVISDELKNIICYECSGMGTKEVMDYLSDSSIDNKFSKFCNLAISLNNLIFLSIIESTKKQFEQNINFYICLASHSVNRNDYATANTVIMSLEYFDTLIKENKRIECKDLYEELKQLFDPTSSYKNLRNKLDNSDYKFIFPVQIFSKDLTFLKDGNVFYDKDNHLKPSECHLIYELGQAKLDAIPKFNPPFKTSLINLLDDQPFVNLAFAISCITTPTRFFKNLGSMCKEFIDDLNKLNLNNKEQYIPTFYKRINILLALVENWLPEEGLLKSEEIKKIYRDEKQLYIDTLKLIPNLIRDIESNINDKKNSVLINSLIQRITMFQKFLEMRPVV